MMKIYYVKFLGFKCTLSTTMDNVCWKMCKDMKSEPVIPTEYMSALLMPFAMLENGKMKTCVGLKYYVNITRGLESGKMHIE